MPYPALTSLFDALFPPGRCHYWKADFVRELTDEAIAIHAEYGPRVPSDRSLMHLYPLDGAVQQVTADATAFSYRDVRFIHVISGIDPDASAMPAHVSWVRDYWAALHPHSAGAAYVNFLMDEGPERVRATYRANYARLVEVKRRWDPNNLFQMNQNIRPDDLSAAGLGPPTASPASRSSAHSTSAMPADPGGSTLGGPECGAGSRPETGSLHLRGR
jgi:hypothetical protein